MILQRALPVGTFSGSSRSRERYQGVDGWEEYGSRGIILFGVQYENDIIMVCQRRVARVGLDCPLSPPNTVVTTPLRETKCFVFPWHHGRWLDKLAWSTTSDSCPSRRDSKHSRGSEVTKQCQYSSILPSWLL